MKTGKTIAFGILERNSGCWRDDAPLGALIDDIAREIDRARTDLVQQVFNDRSQGYAEVSLYGKNLTVRNPEKNVRKFISQYEKILAKGHT
jgi:hypothetical protein